MLDGWLSGTISLDRGGGSRGKKGEIKGKASDIRYYLQCNIEN